MAYPKGYAIFLLFFLLCFLRDFLFFAQVSSFEPERQAFAGQLRIDKQSDCNADTGINNTIQRINNIRLYWGIEQNNAQHDAARLDCASPLEVLAAQNQSDNADKQKQQHQKMAFSIGIEHNIDAKQQHSDKTAQNRADETVSAVQFGIFHAVSHAENGTDTGKSGVSVNQIVQKGAKSGGKRGFKVALTDMKLEIRVVLEHKK